MIGIGFNKVFKKLGSVKLNPNILIFGFFLVIASLFWVFNALNKEYTTKLKLPIVYINSPDNKLIAGGQSTNIMLEITASGYRVINYKTAIIEPLIINLKDYKPKLIEGSKNKKYYILTQTIKDLIIKVLGNDTEIMIVGPDSLIFSMDEVISKKVIVLKNFDLVCKKQFMLKNEVKILPDSITIKGVKSLLDTISEVYTVYDKFNELDGSQSYEMELVTIPGTEFSTNMVICKIEVEEFTEMVYELPVEVINVPENLKIKIYPTNAKISANVGFSMYKSIYKDQFRLVVDYKDAGNSQASRLRVKIAKSPDFISSLRIFPQSVDYIIESND